jgi:phage repressor protein C with HTH and peptisase S24 domain
MSTKKYTNVEIVEIHARLMDALGLVKKKDLAERLNISAQTLQNREDRGVKNLDDIKLLCSQEGLSWEWVSTGKGEMRSDANNKTVCLEDNETYKALPEPVKKMIQAMQENPGMAWELYALAVERIKDSKKKRG